MAKKTRKQRKIEKECELKRQQKFEYSEHEKRVCQHYDMNIYGRFFKTYLKRTRSGDYVCSKCKKKFTSAQKDALEALCKYFTASGKKSVGEVEKILIPDIMPNEFYDSSPNEKTYELIKVTPEEMISDYEARRMISKEETLKYFEHLRQRAKDGILTGKETWKSEVLYYQNIYSDNRAEDDFEYSLESHCFISSYRLKPKIISNFPDCSIEELIEIIAHSDSAEEAYEKVGKRLSNIRQATDSRELLKAPESVIYQEDLFEYLIVKMIPNKRAYEMMCKVRQGTEIIWYEEGYTKNSEYFGNLGNDFCKWFDKVKYLPGRNLIFAIFSETNI